MNNIRKISSEDIVMWCDGTWCYWDEIDEMNHMSDDYRIIPAESEEWNQIVLENA